MLKLLQRLATQRGYTMVEQLAAGAIGLTAAAAVVPASLNTVNSIRSNGVAHAVVNHVAVAKLRATSNFTRARVYMDLRGNAYHLELWQKTGVPGWVTEGGIELLPTGVTFGYGSLMAPPPLTQTTLAQAPACLDNAGNAIGYTACIMFNSAGLPIDGTGTPTANDAVYMIGSGGVFGMTISATSRVQLWWSPTGTASWARKQ